MKKNLVMRAIQEIYPNFYGGYIDLTPEGEVILGGENQEQTRETLAPVGVHL